MYETPYSTLCQTFDVTPTLQASLFPTISQTTNFYRPSFSGASDYYNISIDADEGDEYSYYRKIFKSGAKTKILSTNPSLSTGFITAISITGAVVFFIIIGIAWFIVRQRKAGVDDPHKNEEESCDEDMLYHVYSLNQDDNQDALLEFFNYRVGNAPDTITEMNEDYDTSFRKDD